MSAQQPEIFLTKPKGKNRRIKTILREEIDFFIKVLKSYDMKIMMPQILWSGVSKAYWIGLLAPVMWE